MTNSEPNTNGTQFFIIAPDSTDPEAAASECLGLHRCRR
jgi:cyclophilin family peptidyl-prolyl cis-trans isomerase